jgi:hypothetical protein
MTATDIPDDILAPIEAIAAAYTAKVTQAEGTEADNADLRAQLAAAEQQLAALTPKPRTRFGAAAVSAASFDGLGLEVERQYHTGVPTRFAKKFAAAKFTLDSIRPAAGLTDAAAVTAYARSIAAQAATLRDAAGNWMVELILDSEDDNPNKGMTPKVGADRYDFYAPLIQAECPGITVASTWMAYTPDVRTPGADAYLAEFVGRKIVVGKVTWDGYSHAPGYKSAHDIFEGPRLLVERTFPGMRQSVTEFGVNGTGAARAKVITEAGPYFIAAEFEEACYFNENITAVKAWNVDNDPPALAAVRSWAA